MARKPCSGCANSLRYRSDQLVIPLPASDFENCFGKRPVSEVICRGACQQRVDLFVKYGIVFREVSLRIGLFDPSFIVLNR